MLRISRGKAKEKDFTARSLYPPRADSLSRDTRRRPALAGLWRGKQRALRKQEMCFRLFKDRIKL
jgi:hypothetical protein